MEKKAVIFMKLLHLSDLHIGKRLHEASLLEDQRYILDRIADIVRQEAPDGVLIAGDVYDRIVPPAEAVRLLDDLLVKLSAAGAPVFLISGNHDSPERLSFASRLLEKSRLYISPVYEGRVSPITLEDAHGPVDIWLLPFLKPVHLRHFFPEESIESYTDALACAIRHMDLDPSRRNILVTHQFVTGAARCQSEESSVGGADNVDAAVFDPFDYVALGHLHGPQDVCSPRIRYCGTPLKYSFSEAGQQKSVTVAELGEKGELRVRTVPLTPLRDLKEIRGSYDTLAGREFYQSFDREVYLHAILTDEEDVPDAVGKLRSIYPNLLWLSYDNRRTRAGAPDRDLGELEALSPLELFAQFYERQNGGELSEDQRICLSGLIEEVWEEIP